MPNNNTKNKINRAKKFNATLFPTLEEALYLHNQLIKKFGGQSGTRDLGLLESALARPRSGYYETLSLQAAALFQSILLNHCFLDGNKRTAFALTAIFLKLNGFTIKTSPKDAEKFILETIKNKKEIKEIAIWLERHLK